MLFSVGNFLHTVHIPKVGDFFMPGVKVRDGESFEAAIRRFKKQCEKAGILSELRKREFFEKPSIREKRKAAAARKRSSRRGPSSKG